MKIPDWLKATTVGALVIAAVYFTSGACFVFGSLPLCGAFWSSPISLIFIGVMVVVDFVALMTIWPMPWHRCF